MNRTYEIITHQDNLRPCTNIYLVCEESDENSAKRFVLNIEGKWQH